MLVSKVAPLFLFILAAVAEKKIELQDIEEDNLKSEKETQTNHIEQSEPLAPEVMQRLHSTEFVKSGPPLLRYFERPLTPQPRYTQQYDVTEQPESHFEASAPSAPSAPSGISNPAQQFQYEFPNSQQVLVGYLSNFPMRVYLVPQPQPGEYGPAMPHFITPDTGNPQTTQLFTPDTASHQNAHLTSPGTNKIIYSTSPAAIQHNTKVIYSTSPEAVQHANKIVYSTSPAAVQHNTKVIYPTSPEAVQHANKIVYSSSPKAVQHTNKVVYSTPPETEQHNNKGAYPTSPEAVQCKNYVEVPTAYARTFYSPPAPGYSAPSYVTCAPQANIVPVQSTEYGPIIRYQYAPVMQYAAHMPAMGYIKHYKSDNELVDTEEVIERPKNYATQTEAPYAQYLTQRPRHYNSPAEYPRYYNSRAPIRQDPRHGAISEIPPPNPLILKNPPPHLAHLPKALPMTRPVSKVYPAGTHGPYIQRPNEIYPVPRKPSSLLDSYIPSSVQLEYMKRGYTKDPPQAYEALSRVHQYLKREYEKGFLPNQMYHTATGGIVYGHYKRNSKSDTAAKSGKQSQ